MSATNIRDGGSKYCTYAKLVSKQIPTSFSSMGLFGSMDPGLPLSHVGRRFWFI
jgi:hypothetical protein